MKRHSFLLTLLIAIFLGGCGAAKTRSDDALSAARDALALAADAEPCAEAEFRAAQNLLDQAEQAFANKKYDDARTLADQAVAQAQRAREVAAANAETCLRNQTTTVELPPNPNGNNNSAAAGPYEFVAVLFDFNESSLSDRGRRIVEMHATELKARTALKVTLEGHCDERGTMEYNFALGERRARSVKSYLERMGVDGSRLSTVSYGSEMPASTDFSLNRRVEFKVR